MFFSKLQDSSILEEKSNYLNVYKIFISSFCIYLTFKFIFQFYKV